MADTTSAWEILEGMDPGTALTRYAPGGYSGHNIDTVGEMLDDSGLRSLNDELQDLLNGLIKSAADERYTLAQVRAHPWFALPGQ